MDESNDLIRERLKKLEKIQNAGLDPFGGRFIKEHPISFYTEHFEEKKPVKTAGRLTPMRTMGKSTFCDLRDDSGRVQLYIKKDILGDKDFALFECLDIGDIIGVEGELFKTKTGELSVRATALTILSKSLRSLPEKWHGLKDVEVRYRKRYLDLLSNEKTRDIFKKRSQIIAEIRKILDEKGYLEVETPMMHSIPGGAAGKPFKTYHEALGLDLYMRVAPELYLKKLLVGGFDKVYEINKSFRNEGISTRHNPEFTMLEVYTAYHDVNDVMALTEELVKQTALKIFGTLQIPTEDKVMDLSRWERISFAGIMKDHFDIAPEDSVSVWIKKLTAKGVKLEGKDLSRTQLINIVGELLEPGTGASKAKDHPFFVTDYFTELCPLAKKSKDNPHISDRFELYIGGMEIANGYSELNNPIEQRQRLLDELKAKGKEATSDTLDEDFLCALEHGMPPAGGLGIGIDRLVMLLTGQSSIREVILFPQMKKE